MNILAADSAHIDPHQLQAVSAALGTEVFWLSLGFVAQAMFLMRFLVQWISSERAGRSIVPVSFWYFSIAGSVGLFGYAIYRRDPVFILGQCGGVLIYVRNLQLIRNERSGRTTEGSEERPG